MISTIYLIWVILLPCLCIYLSVRNNKQKNEIYYLKKRLLKLEDMPVHVPDNAKVDLMMQINELLYAEPVGPNFSYMQDIVLQELRKLIEDRTKNDK